MQYIEVAKAKHRNLPKVTEVALPRMNELIVRCHEIVCLWRGIQSRMFAQTLRVILQEKNKCE